MKNVQRELHKAFCGFLPNPLPHTGIATGNWGGGAFGGDPQHKMLIQWMAASEAGQKLVEYHPYNDPRMSELERVASLCSTLTVAEAHQILVAYSHHTQSTPIPMPFFDFVIERLKNRVK